MDFAYHSGLRHDSILLGSDPEFWVVKNGKLVLPSDLASGFLKPKVNMFECTGMHTYYGESAFFSRDGATVELWHEADSCRDRLVPSIGKALSQLATYYGVNLRAWPAMSIKDIIETHDELPDDVLVGGCEPETCAYTGRVRGTTAYKDDMRFAGGHIHLGAQYDSNRRIIVNNTVDIVKALDILLAAPMLVMFSDNDELMKAERLRKRFYGRAGSYRQKGYGLEYRVLSNMAFCHPIVTRVTFFLARRAAMLKQEPFLRFVYENYSPLDIRRMIDKVDVDQLKEFVRWLFLDEEVLYGGGYYEHYQSGVTAKFICNVIEDAGFSYLDGDLDYNWQLRNSIFADHSYIDIFSLYELKSNIMVETSDHYCEDCDDYADYCGCGVNEIEFPHADLFKKYLPE